MTQIVFVILFVIFGTVCSTVHLQCPPGEVEDTCPRDCYKDSCPTKELKNLECSNTGECGTPRCKCPFNQKRDLNGACVYIRDCPPFECNGPNEEYVACPPLCPTDDCKQSTPDGNCPISGYMFILTVIECNPACRCTKGHWRKDGKCVPYKECPEHATPLPIIPLGY